MYSGGDLTQREMPDQEPVRRRHLEVRRSREPHCSFCGPGRPEHTQRVVEQGGLVHAIDRYREMNAVPRSASFIADACMQSARAERRPSEETRALAVPWMADAPRPRCQSLSINDGARAQRLEMLHSIGL